MYKYGYEYFLVPNEKGLLKSHIMMPHTERTLCGWDEEHGMKTSHKVAYDLTPDSSLCGSCLNSLGAWLESRGTDAVALHVYKALMKRLTEGAPFRWTGNY